MVPAIKKTSDLVQEIAAAIAGAVLRRGPDQQRDEAAQPDTQQNASASEELAATAEEMSGQAEKLQQLVAFFKMEADGEPGVREQHEKRAAPARQAPPPLPLRAAAPFVRAPATVPAASPVAQPAAKRSEEREFVRF